MNVVRFVSDAQVSGLTQLYVTTSAVIKKWTFILEALRCKSWNILGNVFMPVAFDQEGFRGQK